MEIVIFVEKEKASYKMKIDFCVLSVILFLSLTACGPAPGRHVAATLDDVESYINERPDSALAVLRALDSFLRPLPRRRSAGWWELRARCYWESMLRFILSEWKGPIMRLIPEHSDSALASVF